MRVWRKALCGMLSACLVLLTALGLLGYLFIRRAYPQTSGTLPVAGLEDRTEVYRDRWGIPHIYARNEHDAYFAQGYVHAQDRLWQMDYNRRVAAGRLSEVLGRQTLEVDRLMRTVGLHRAAAADWQDAPPDTVEMLEAYAEGVNAFIQTHGDRLPIEFVLLGYVPEAWSPVDSVLWAKLMSFYLCNNWESELVRQQLIQTLGWERTRDLAPPYPEGARLIIPADDLAYSSSSAEVLQELRHVRAFLGAEDAGLGSNNWVVDGTMTATGRPILANDTHLGIQLPSIWYEVQLVGGELDVAGFSFPGSPGIVIGHNRHIAWGVTNAMVDVQDLYVERINPDDPDQYEFRGLWENMTVIEEQIAVSGEAEPETWIVRLTRHGPILSPALEGQEEVLSLRWTALEPEQLLQSLSMLNLAQGWRDFREALRHWHSPPQNFVYADAEGNIGYVLPGAIPIRDQGDGLVPAPGWSGLYEWTGYVPFDELPSVLNPTSHFIVTANNKVVSDDYPYLLSEEWAEPYRAERIAALLGSGKPLTLEDMRAIQADEYSLPAEQLTALVLSLPPEDWRQERAFRFLEGWDFQLESDSGAAGIIQVLTWRMMDNTFGDELESSGIEEFAGRISGLLSILEDNDNAWFDDVRTAAVENRDDILSKSARETMDFWGRRFGDLPGNKDAQWGWGKVHFAEFDHPLGSWGPLGLLLNVRPLAMGGSGDTVNAVGYKPGEFTVRVLPSQRQIIDVGRWRDSLSQHTTGQSGHPLHPHYSDMLRDYQQVRPHAMLYERNDVRANMEGLLVLTPAD